MEWLFDGIGSEIIGIVLSLIIGAIGGGAIVYKIAIKHTSMQSQEANNNSKQKQEIVLNGRSKESGGVKVQNRISQSQKAGDGSTQTQFGRITNGRN